jgi:hypothetical protein
MIKTPTLTNDQKRLLQSLARQASKECGMTITGADVLAKVLENANFLDIRLAYYRASPAKVEDDKKQLAFDLQRQRDTQRRNREGRAFLRVAYRGLRKDGQPDPMQRACAALATKLATTVDKLNWEMRPPEWTPRPIEARPAGWWYRAGRKRPKSAPAWDDRYWPGRSRFLSEKQKAEHAKARKAAFAADVEHEKKRLEVIARRRGVAATAFCPEHGDRLFACDQCIRPKRHAFVDGHSYGDSLREAIFGSAVLSGKKKPSRVLLFPARPRKVAA